MKLIVLALAAIGLSTSTDISCSQGEVTDTSNICIQPKYIEGCHKYASKYMCNKCEYKYKLNEYGLCQYQKQSGQACCLEKKSGQCTKCNYGLKLYSDGSCRENSIVGCLQKEQQGNCVNCSSEYFLENGLCKQGIKQCLKYSEENEELTCSECKKNYSLVNNACLKNRILGCEYEANHKCQKCIDPFKKSADHCEISNCSTYNDFGCTACQCGYFLNPKNTCQEIQPGCVRYQRGACIDCQPHFKLRGGSCMIEGCQQLEFLECKRCSDGYTLADGGCAMNNCVNWDNGICFVCAKGYVTQQGKCIEENKQSAFYSASA